MPLTLEVPGWATLELAHLVLDVNGTIALDGALLAGVGDRLVGLQRQLTVHLVSADTQGRLDAVAAELGLRAQRLTQGLEAEQKARFVQSIGATQVVAVGNGANDVAMLQAAALGIAVLGPEGMATAALTAADVLVASIHDALDLLTQPRRLVATLRR
ncbi:MAG TPA: HAD hydrolase family protein [Chloroflexota bacterium]|nr:HAD hydrolase family protein [Chloroflexota bacterium]